MYEINQEIVIDHDGALRSGTILAAGIESVFGQFLTIQLDEPYQNEDGYTIKTVSTRVKGSAKIAHRWQARVVDITPDFEPAPVADVESIGY